MRTAHALPLSQLESMTLSYIPLFTVTYFFWWSKPKDIMTPSIIELPSMTTEQKEIFESMAVSDKFDDEGLRAQSTYWNVWYLTPRLFEKEEEDRAKEEVRTQNSKMQEKTTGTDARNSAVEEARDDAKKEDAMHEIAIISVESHVSRISTTVPDDVPIEMLKSVTDIEHAIKLPTNVRKEIVLSQWDPELYRSNLWPLICLFGASFGALHLISWDTSFPALVEKWFWRSLRSCPSSP